MAQLAWLWSRHRFDTSALPSAFASIRRYGAPAEAQLLRLVWRARSDSTAEYTHYDAWVIDEQDRVRLVFEDAESTGSKALGRMVSG